MKKYKVYSDCHRNGVDPLPLNFSYQNETIFLGDNFEFKNLPIKKIVSAQLQYLTHITRVKKHGCVELRGNHEVSYSKGADFHLLDGILFSHGHHIFWSEKKIRKWEQRPAGQGFLGRLLSKRLAKLRKVFKKTSLSKKQMIKLDAYADKIQKQTKTKIHTVVFGHTHPNCMITKIYNDRKYINVKRGETILWNI